MPGQLEFYNCLHKMDVNTGVWSELMATGPSDGGKKPAAKSGAGMVHYEGRLVLFGGCCGDIEQAIVHPGPWSQDQFTVGGTNELHVFEMEKGTCTMFVHSQCILFDL